MPPRKSGHTGPAKRTALKSRTPDVLPTAVRDLLAEAGVSASEPTASEAPPPPDLKRRRPGVVNRASRSAQRRQTEPSDKPLRQLEEQPTLQSQLLSGPKPSSDLRTPLSPHFQPTSASTFKTKASSSKTAESVPAKPLSTQAQTAELSSDSNGNDSSDDDDDDDDDIVFEDVEVSEVAHAFDYTTIDKLRHQAHDAATHANINAPLTASSLKVGASSLAAKPRQSRGRAELAKRVAIHKVHIMCLLSHVSRRNRWCNDEAVQDVLRELLTEKMVTYLNPPDHLPQFGKSESLKTGVRMVGEMFYAKFFVTERGMKRALWAAEPDDLEHYKPLEHSDSAMNKEHFLKFATELEGSRDVGAQLFCALLRSAGVEARLVCSLQPLAFGAGSPTLPRPEGARLTSKTRRQKQAKPRPIYRVAGEVIPTGPAQSKPSFVQRMGYDKRWLDYDFYLQNQRSSLDPKPVPEVVPGGDPVNRFKESPFPVYWVEVLDTAHQKWLAVDPIVTQSYFFKQAQSPTKLEPTLADRDNNALVYAIGFDDAGNARDVTRRYAKAYNAKTRRQRLEGLSSPTPGEAGAIAGNSGDKWLRKVLRFFGDARTISTDLQQIEDHELGRLERSEPMPRNLVDFRDHPMFALERHLRKAEVLIPGAESCGTVAVNTTAPSRKTAGSGGGSGGLERVYRRRDVRVARSKDKWFRLGRVVKPGEVPVKILAVPQQPAKSHRSHRRQRRWWGDPVTDDDEDVRPRKKSKTDDDDDGESKKEKQSQSNQLFTIEQTSLYKPPPVLSGGRIPKNKFGNVEVFVPSMIPAGAVHVDDDYACRAAYVLGIDYAPALVGFSFRGRGAATAKLQGAVVAKEFAAAVEAVIEGLKEQEQEQEEEMRRERALRMWDKMLQGLRIRARIWRRFEERHEVDTPEMEEEVDEEDDEVLQAEEEEEEDDDDDVDVEEQMPPTTNRTKVRATSIAGSPSDAAAMEHGATLPGGFCI